MNKHIVIVLLFIPLLGSAQQQDYLVLHEGDTLYGKYINRNSINKTIHFRTDRGTIKLPTTDVKEFYWKSSKHRVYKDPCESGMSAYRVLIEGSVSFLHSGGREDYCPDLILINDEIYPFKRRDHFSKEAWSRLSKCTAFEEKYTAYYNEHRNQTIVWEWTYRKSRTKWLEMIRYFNANCGKTIQ
ncbi:MAG TPA: hypothetical protein PKE63_10965 [Lacibacter sp.]|nr:hypothetical protein [Lacibacter sp.]HMO89623.1 hypothetical protein [Lacibacter sp.]HMP87791.1 hypothetical protein [Lacibacter sp.]